MRKEEDLKRLLSQRKVMERVIREDEKEVVTL